MTEQRFDRRIGDGYDRIDPGLLRRPGHGLGKSDRIGQRVTHGGGAPNSARDPGEGRGRGPGHQHLVPGRQAGARCRQRRTFITIGK